MRIAPHWFIALSACLCAQACGASATTETAASQSALDQRAEEGRARTLLLSLGYVAYAADQKRSCVTGSPPCNDVVLEIDATGFSDGLGEVQVHQRHVVHVDTQTFTEGTFIVTSRHGRLEGRYVGRFAPAIGGTPPHPVGLFIYGGPIEVTGGTGRFRGATGSLRFWVSQDLTDTSLGAVARGPLALRGGDDH